MFLLNVLITTVLWKVIDGQAADSVGIVFQDNSRSICITNSSYGMIWNYDIAETWENAAKQSVYIMDEFSTVNCALEEGDNCRHRWINNGWRMSNSIDDDLGEVIFDRRWEEFPVYRTEIGEFKMALNFYKRSSFAIPISVRKTHNAHVIICEDEDASSDSICYWFVLENPSNVTGIRKCKARDIPRGSGSITGSCRSFKYRVENINLFDENLWRHLIIEKQENVLKLSQVSYDKGQIKRRNVFSYVDDESDSLGIQIEYLFIHAKSTPALWKIHAYSYIEPFSNLVTQQIGPDLHSTGYICISFFLYMCKTCSLSVFVESIDGKVLWNATYTAPFRWEEVKIKILNIQGKSRLYVFPMSSSSKSKDNFWLFDSVQKCTIEGYRFLATKTDKARGCQILDHSFPLSPQVGLRRDSVGNVCDFETFSSYCIPCRIFSTPYQEKNYCDPGQVWDFSESGQDKFVCTSGYTNTDCESACSRGYYGFDCKLQCGQCYDVCNSKNGKCLQGDCRNGFTGDRCDNPPGIIWNAAPDVSAVGYTKCTLRFPPYAGYLGSDPPDFYFFQIKGDDPSAPWSNVSGTNAIYSIKDNLSPVEVDNLNSSSSYLVRVVVFKWGGAVYTADVGMKTVGFKTACKEVEPEDLRIDVTNSTAEIKLRDLESRTLCPLHEYTFALKEKTRHAKANSKYKFGGLNPYTDYTLYYSNKNGERIQKTFKTSEGVPGKVVIETKTSSTKTISITWNKPDVTNGQIKHYTVKYKLKKRKACGTPLNYALQKKETSNLSIELKDLEPYSIYTVLVSASTIYEGESIGEDIHTQQLDYFDEKEEPVKGGAEITPEAYKLNYLVNCNLTRGPVFIRGKAQCQEKWCRDVDFSVRLDTTQEHSQIEVGGLEPYSKYNIQSMACRRDDSRICQRPIEEVITTKPTIPHPVQDVSVYTRDEKSISLRWKPPSPPTGQLYEYKVDYSYPGVVKTYYHYVQIKVEGAECIRWPDFHCVRLTKEIYKNYEYTIQVASRNVQPDEFSDWSSPISTVARTANPGAPYDLSLRWLENDTFIVSWKHPNETNGDLTDFLIYIYAGGSPSSTRHSLDNNQMYQLVYQHLIPYKLPSTMYKVEIRSENRAGQSFGRPINDTSPPPKPVFDGLPFMSSMTNNSVVITFPKLSVNISNYEFTNYICILINDTDNSAKKYNTSLKGQIEKHVEGYGDEYRLVYCGVNNSTKKRWKFTIGEDDNNNITDDYNPPLKPGRYYTVVVYAHNEFNGKSKHQVFLIPSNTGTPSIAPSTPPEDSKSWTFALILLLIIPLLLLFVYRKMKNKDQCFSITLRRQESLHESVDDDVTVQDSIPLTNKPMGKTLVNIPLVNKSSPSITRTNKPFARKPLINKPKANKPAVRVAVISPTNKKAADESTDATKLDDNNSPDPIHSNVVQIVDFEEYVKNAIKTGELEKQHALFPRGQTKPWDYGALKVNKPKNRYNNLIAYDHTRVKLDKIEGDQYSDYINANYIDGYRAPKAYIATQGPKPSTLNDFWRMIWLENVRNIIMLANIYEGGKKKVEQYWPNINEELQFGDIKVQYLSTDIFADFEYRIFTVSCKGEERRIEQLHFTSWPDHGVPLYSQSLVPFLQKILKIPVVRNSPIVIHCSAGVGRTGTIILCDMSLRMAAREGSVDILRILEKIRSQRPNMVDNYEQYKLAHLVVLECLIGLQTSIPCNDEMEAKIQNVIQTGGIRTQMKYLQDTAWQDQAMTTIVETDEPVVQYPKKNRNQNIVPEKHSRIFISRYPVDDEASCYINAVEVDDFRTPGRFLVTQQPLPTTLGDFWRLAVEKEVTTIISLNEIDKKDKTCCQIWPTKDNPKIRPVDYITLEHSKSTHLECYDIHNIHLLTNDKDEVTVVQIIAMKKWLPKKVLPPSPEAFLTFWEEAHAHSRGSAQVIVTCYDGATACGIYAAMSFLIEKMKLEQQCDVCQAVRNIRHNRKQFIETQEQYKFLLETSLKYINGFQSYANFN